VLSRATEVIEDQLEVWVAVGDLGDLRRKFAAIIAIGL